VLKEEEDQLIFINNNFFELNKVSCNDDNKHNNHEFNHDFNHDYNHESRDEYNEYDEVPSVSNSPRTTLTNITRSTCSDASSCDNLSVYSMKSASSAASSSSPSLLSSSSPSLLSSSLTPSPTSFQTISSLALSHQNLSLLSNSMIYNHTFLTKGKDIILNNKLIRIPNENENEIEENV